MNEWIDWMQIERDRCEERESEIVHKNMMISVSFFIQHTYDIFRLDFVFHFVGRCCSSNEWSSSNTYARERASERTHTEESKQKHYVRQKRSVWKRERERVDSRRTKSGKWQKKEQVCIVERQCIVWSAFKILVNTPARPHTSRWVATHSFFFVLFLCAQRRKGARSAKSSTTCFLFCYRCCCYCR